MKVATWMVLVVGDVVFTGGREGGDELNVCGNILAVNMVIECFSFLLCWS